MGFGLVGAGIYPPPLSPPHPSPSPARITAWLPLHPISSPLPPTSPSPSHVSLSLPRLPLPPTSPSPSICLPRLSFRPPHPSLSSLPLTGSNQNPVCRPLLCTSAASAATSGMCRPSHVERHWHMPQSPTPSPSRSVPARACVCALVKPKTKRKRVCAVVNEERHDSACSYVYL